MCPDSTSYCFVLHCGCSGGRRSMDNAIQRWHNPTHFKLTHRTSSTDSAQKASEDEVPFNRSTPGLIVIIFDITVLHKSSSAWVKKGKGAHRVRNSNGSTFFKGSPPLFLRGGSDI